MEFLIAVSSAILGEIAKNTVAPIGSHLGFLFLCKSKQDSLLIRVQELDNAITSLQRRVEVAQRNGEEAEEGLTEWLEEAEKRSERAKDFWSGEKAKCAGVSLRYKIGMEASAMARMVDADTEKASKLGLVFHRPILRSSFWNRDFEAFATTIQTEGKIIEALRETDLGVIGVYGAGGIGKSTLVQEVARCVQEEELFSKVVIVTVSQTYSIHKIQQEIADALGMDSLA